MAIVGRLTLDTIAILEVDADPSIDGARAFPGSLALQFDLLGTSSGFWLKTGITDTNWTPIATTDFLVTHPGPGLEINYTTGDFWVGGTLTNVAAGTLILPPTNSGYVYVDATSLTVQFTIGSLPAFAMPLASFVTNAVNVLSLNNVKELANHVRIVGTPVTLTPDAANNTGTALSDSASDHVHNIPTAAAATISSNANTQGAAATFARSNHTHQITTVAALSTQIPQYDGTNWIATYPESLISLRNGTQLLEDWIAGAVAGNLNWVTTASSGTANLIAATSNSHPGVVQLSVSSSGNSVSLGLGTTSFILGGGALLYEFDVLIPTLSTSVQEFVIRMGLGGGPTSADQNNGAYFEYNRATTGDFWVIKTANSATRTAITTTVAIVADTWYRLTCSINAAATSVSFSINGVVQTSISTNIPTSNVDGPFFHIVKTNGGVARVFDVDYFTLYQHFTTPR